jgi:hypothetical protein
MPYLGYFSTFISRITGSGVPGSMPLPRQASHRLKPGLPGIAYPGYFQHSSAGSGVPGRMPLPRQGFTG